MFTPGPWEISKGTSEYSGEFSIHNGVTICRGDDEAKEWEGNARLIAAAPEMYDALVDAEFLLRKAGRLAGPMQDSLRRASADIQAIIAKIEGK